MVKYKFYIPYFLSTREVFPLNGDGIKFRKQRHEKGSHRFVEKLSGDIIFINDKKNNHMDFDFFYEIETNPSLRCEEFTMHIHRSCDNGNTYSLYKTTYFKLNDCEWDLDRCTLTVKPELEDKYRCILKKYNEKFNLVLSGPLITIKNDPQLYYEFFYCEIPPGPNFTPIPPDCFPSTPSNDTWTYFYTDNEEPDPIGAPGVYEGTIVIYMRNIATTINIGGVSTPPTFGTGWVYLPGSDNGITSQYVSPYTGPAGSFGMNIESQDCGDPPSFPFEFYGAIKIIDCVGGKDWWYIADAGLNTDYTQFRTMQNAMEYIVNQACPGINEVVSDFFEWNPIGDAPGYVAGKNYVTGDTNIVATMAIAQKSDVIDPAATNKATRGEISLKKLMDNLKVLFNVDWFIDDDNNFRVEHESFFNYTVAHNANTGANEKRNIAKNKYTYKRDMMPSIERFSMMEAGNIDFIGFPITYNSNCANQEGDDREVEYFADQITTDINLIDSFPDDISKYGFVLVVYRNDGTDNKVLKEVGKYTGQLINNGHLAFANLQYNYHRHGRVLLEGTMNLNTETFLSAVKTKLQKGIEIVICCGETELDPETKSIQTELGVGLVEEYEFYKNIVTLSLLH